MADPAARPRPTAPARRTRRPSAFAGWPGLLAEPGGRRVRAPRSRASGPGTPTGSGAGRVRGGEARRRPGAIRARVGGAPEYEAPPRRAADRRRPDLRRARAGPPRVAPELFQEGVRRAAGCAGATTGQLWGNPLYDWTAMRDAGYRWWIERFAVASSSSDLAPRRPLPRPRRLLGRPRASARRAKAATGAAAPARGVRAGAPRSSATLALIAEDLGVITPPSSGCGVELGAPRNDGAAVRA